MKKITDKIREKLFSLKDLKYRDFSSSLMPTVNPETVIGVRIPRLRKFAKEIATEKDISLFLNTLPHKYFEENNLHAFIIEQTTDFSECIKEIDKFLPFVDNWATCDSMRPKCFKNHREELLEKIDEWLVSSHTYTVRYGIEMLMVYFLDELFCPEYLKKVAEIKSDEYYINMMIAWYFATALAKQYDGTLPYITEKVLPDWVHNKTIQKVVESYRLTREQKEFLKKFKKK